MTTRGSRTGGHQHRLLALAFALAALACPQGKLFGQVPSAGMPGVAYPEFRTTREVVVFGVGATMLIAGHFAAVDPPLVPAGGLDATKIGWSVDRDVVGTLSLDAHLASNWTRNAALVLPFALALAGGPSDERWEGFGRRSAVITQAFVVSQGITSLAKSTIGRARPYTYVSDTDRLGDPAYNVERSSAFASMPSGHSSSAWTGAALAVTEYLLSHPDADWARRGGLGLLAGALAGSTSALRVQAGQHFPSDVLVGAGIGIAAGVAIPLLHRGLRAQPSTGAWLQASGGIAAGTLAGILFARRY